MSMPARICSSATAVSVGGDLIRLVPAAGVDPGLGKALWEDTAAAVGNPPGG
jgi:hypothetical protein